jgi:hypothetical protein
MAWITNNTLMVQVAARLGLQNAAALPEHWSQIIPDANDTAYNEIVGILVGRGFSLAQVNQFDNIQNWNRTIALGYAFQEAALRGDQYQQVPIDKMMKLLEELPTKKCTVQGILVLPTGTGVRIGAGPEYTGMDRIQLQPPDGTGQFMIPPPGDGCGTGTVL